MSIRVRLLLGLFISLSLTACRFDTSTSPPANTSADTSAQAAKPSNLNLTVLDISERSRDDKNAIAITFSTPLDPQINFQPLVAIQKADDKTNLEGAWVLSDDHQRLWFMNTEPETRYNITVNVGLKAQNGTQITAPKTINLVTRSLSPTVGFTSKGSILPLGYHGGLPITTTNINQVDVDFFRIKPENLNAFVTATDEYGRGSWYHEQYTALGDLVYTGRFDLNPQKNTRTQRDLPVQTLNALKKPGLYLAIMRVAGQYDDKKITWFSMSDLGVHLRQYNQQMTVLTHSLITGKPQKDTKVTLLDASGKTLFEALTDQQGQVNFTGDISKTRLILAQKDAHLSMIEFTKPALDLSEFDLGKRPQLPTELFLYSPRDLYRPGETLTVNGLLRDFDGRVTQPQTFKLVIQAPDGTTASEQTWAPNTDPTLAPGYYQLHWPIPANAATGKWQIQVTGSFKSSVLFNFNVEDFLPERMKLTLAEGRPQSIHADISAPVSLKLKGEYLYGAPAAHQKMSAFYQISPWRSPIESLKDFEFGHIKESEFTAYEELDEFKLNDQGDGQIEIESSWANTQSPLKLNVVASLYETGGRAITRSHPTLIWPKNQLIGIRTTFENDTATAQGVATFELVNTNLQGELLAANALEVTLVTEDRQYFWEYSNQDGWHWNWNEKEYPVYTDNVNIEAGRTAKINLPVQWGSYRLEIKNPVTGLISSTRFFAGYDWYHDWQNAQTAAAPRPDRINLALDKPLYSSGDTLQLKIVPPAEGDVLIMVEGDYPLWTSSIRVPKEGADIKIPIAQDWQQHNLYVSALLVESASQRQTQITPKRSFGVIHLPLNRESRRLNIDVASPEKSEPGQIINIPIQVRGAPNTPLPAKTFITLAAVDVGILNISQFKTPDPFEYFFGQRRYAPLLHDNYHQIIEARVADKAKLRFGGDADLVRGGIKPKSDVQIVSLFSGPVALNEQGQANIPLNIPDFNGRLRLMALAANDQAYGSTEKELTLAAPLVVEASLPRFLALGDTSQLALDLQNMSDNPLSFSLTVAGTDGLVISSSDHTFQLKPLEKITQRFSIKTLKISGTGKVVVDVKSADIKPLHREWSLGFRPAYPAISVTKNIDLKNQQSATLSAKDYPQLIPDTLQMRVEFGPHLQLGISEHVNNLLHYPYGCLEQTLSSSYPLVYGTPQNQQRFGLNAFSDADRLKGLQAGLDRLTSFQKANGGFGLWSKNDSEEHWLSVYAADFLLDAQSQGITVSDSLLTKLLDRLSYYLNMNGAFIEQRWSTEPVHYAAATRAYAAYVLSKIKKAPLGSLRTLYEREFTTLKSPLSKLYMALALHNMGDQALAQKALEEALKTDYPINVYLGDYGSPIRDYGQMVRVLGASSLDAGAQHKLAIKLKSELAGRQWLSTQEQMAVFLAGLALDQNTTETWTGRMEIGSAPAVAIHQNPNFKQFFAAEDLTQPIKFTSLSDNPIYLDARINGYPKTAPAPESKNMHVEYTWYNLLGQPVQPNKIKVGEMFLVDIALTSNQRINDALIVQLLPAGLELENQNLETAIKMDEFKLGDTPIKNLISNTRIMHQEFRDDRFVAAIQHQGYQASHVFFMVRAVTPGQYQVPPPIAEDMYRPEIRGMGQALNNITVINPE